jgi:hypothetical protein
LRRREGRPFERCARSPQQRGWKLLTRVLKGTELLVDDIVRFRAKRPKGFGVIDDIEKGGIGLPDETPNLRRFVGRMALA